MKVPMVLDSAAPFQTPVEAAKPSGAPASARPTVAVSPQPSEPSASPSLSSATADKPAPAQSGQSLSQPESGQRLPPLIDSHCHIVFRNFDDDLDAVRDRWREAGVTALVHACVEPAEIPAIRALADRFPELRYAVGVHPSDTGHWQDDTSAVLREAALADERVVAIGELGLDLFRQSNLDEQLQVLRPQLDLAVELDLPVIIHCRDAAEPMLIELRSRAAAGRCPAGVMHCWGGTPAEMEAFLELGLFISFSGTVTFPKAEDTHQCARQVPADRYLVETDCPFLAPVPRRGKRNEPAFVVSVAERVAGLRGETLEQVALASTANAQRLFRLPVDVV
jgi:TatD DNase family protein